MRSFVLLSMICLSLAQSIKSQDTTRIQVIHKDKAHNYNGKTFENTIPTILIRKGKKASAFWRYYTSGHRKPHYKFAFKPDSISKLPEANALKVMWIGHATVMIEIDGKRFLTDPIFSNRTSPFIKSRIFNFLWPKRFYSPSEKLADLPKLDGVIISHDHSDHLDYNSIITLGKTGVTFFVPLKVGDLLNSWGIDKQQIVEVNWWDSIILDKTHTLIATPARHGSGRSPLFGKRNQTLWCSWVISGPKHKVFFGGDTGYSPDFKNIGNMYGPFDITFLPIGAYDSSWPDIHINPKEAIAIHKDLKGNVLFPIHWGTFNVAIHPWDEPVKQILMYATQEDVKLSLPRPGELMVWPHVIVNSKWWMIYGSGEKVGE
jgi:L-ascorbate metabolism protein UlaG (beta-lactamase superfamily)